MLGNKVLLSLLPNEYLIILSEVKQLQQGELWLFIIKLTTELLDKNEILTRSLFEKCELNCEFKVVSKYQEKEVFCYSLRLSI